MKPYYYVHRVNGGHPKIKHASLGMANAEAMRLAGQHPGASFEILKCVAVTMTTVPQTFWMDGEAPNQSPENVQAMARRAGDGKTEDGLSPSPSASCSTSSL